MNTQLSDRPLDHIRHIAPIAHGHINMRGIYKFDLSEHDIGGKNGKNVA